MNKRVFWIRLKQLLALSLFVIVCACSSNQDQLPKAPLAYQVKDQIDHDFLIIRDFALESYLHNLVIRLVSNYADQIVIEIAKDQRPFARSFPGALVLVSTGLLEICNSESELAFVISHELGHVVLGHHSQAVARIKIEELKSRELAADSFGAQTILKAGYSISAAFSSIQRLTSIWDFYDNQGDSGYPSAKERLALLQNNIMGQACLMTGSCLMEGIESSRDFVKFRRRLEVILNR